MNAGLAEKATMIVNAKKSDTPITIKWHLEMKSDAYEKFKTSFDEVRKEIDQGMFGDTPEWRALRNARAKLFEMGELLKTELIIVTDSIGESKHSTGGQS